MLALWTLCIIVWKSNVTCYDKVICIIPSIWLDDLTSNGRFLCWRILLFLHVNNMLLYYSCCFIVNILLKHFIVLYLHIIWLIFMNLNRVIDIDYINTSFLYFLKFHLILHVITLIISNVLSGTDRVVYLVLMV